jgi:hypothetical protein
MKAAIDTAEELGLGVALVDRDIQTTVQRFWARLTLREKLTLVGSLLAGHGPPLTVGFTVGSVFGLLGAVLATTLGGLAGFAISRYDFPGDSVFPFVLATPAMVPPTTPPVTAFDVWPWTTFRASPVDWVPASTRKSVSAVSRTPSMRASSGVDRP